MNWKNVFKSWTGVPVLILVVLGVWWLIPNYKSWKWNRAYDKIEEPYYTDTYGGQTPEETYDLFIDALKAGDVELASKYFVLEKQDDWLKTLVELKNSGTLNNYLEELISYRASLAIESQNEEKTILSYQYSRKKSEVIELPVSGNETQKITLPAGTFEGQITLVKYPKVWKIDLL